MGLDYLPYKNSIDVFVEEFQDAATETEITDATMTFSIYDTNGTVISGIEDISMTYQGSNGHYRGSKDLGTLLTVNTSYDVVITCTNYPFRSVQRFLCAERPFVED